MTAASRDILLLHGAIGAADQLESLAQMLRSKGLIPHTFNFSGHGGKSMPSGLSITLFAEELKSFIKANQLHTPHVFGYSMGGYVALYLASEDPEMFGQIITLGSKFNWTETIAEKEIKNLNPNVIRTKVPTFAESLQKRHGDNWELLLNKTADMMLVMGKHNPLSAERIERITNRVLIGLADNDAMVSLDETRAVYSRLQNASMYMLPQTKHPIETADIELLSSIIIKFIF
jgi:pimeloyl-ACP methyl ester carboxylesterase